MLYALLAQIPTQPAPTNNWLVVIAAVAVGLLAFAFLGLKLWLSATRPVAIQDVPTPTLDKLNQNALAHMVEESAEEAEAEMEEKENEAAPADLLAVVPPEEEDEKSNGQKKA